MDWHGFINFFRKSIKGFGFSQQVFCICRRTDFLWKWGSVATNAMLAVNEVEESIVYKKTDCVYTQAMLALIWNWKRAGRKIDEVYRQIICLLSMIITESRHTVFAKTCLCLYTGYACCQRKNKFSLDNFSERKNFHFSLKHCVRTYHKASDFSLLGTYVHTFFTWNEKIYAALLL